MTKLENEEKSERRWRNKMLTMQVKLQCL